MRLDCEMIKLYVCCLQDKFHPGNKSLRCDGMDVAPFHLNITGSIKPARFVMHSYGSNL